MVVAGGVWVWITDTEDGNDTSLAAVAGVGTLGVAIFTAGADLGAIGVKFLGGVTTTCVFVAIVVERGDGLLVAGKQGMAFWFVGTNFAVAGGVRTKGLGGVAFCWTCWGVAGEAVAVGFLPRSVTTYEKNTYICIKSHRMEKFVIRGQKAL